ncbi:MAG: hypothetical protein AB8I08_14600 [Sandaracinaceae bacterium]
MSEALIQQWRQCAQRAAAWDAGESPDSVLEALSLTIATELTGALAQLPGAERDQLRRKGQRALLHVGGAGLDEDDLEALRMCAALARDGLRALSGRTAPQPADLDTRVLIPTSEMRRMLDGDLDGFAAGSLALKIRRSSDARAELRVIETLMQPEQDGDVRRTLSLAAAEAVAVLDPASGRLVGTLPEAGAEAVLFEGTPLRLAVYAEDAAPLRLVGPGLHTEGTREGYWIGRLEPVASARETLDEHGDDSAGGDLPTDVGPGADASTGELGRLETTLQIGERSFQWVLELN